MSVKIETVDTRTITANFPVSPSELANALEGLGDGYGLSGAMVLADGSQRDPKGVRLVFTRRDRG